MVEELKLAIKIDDDAIEQSLLKQFANAEKMADKVVLTFKNIDLDDKNIEAKFKEMQKMAGKNPIDLSINDKSIEMLSAISKQLSNIFEIAKGKSIIDSSATISEINKVTKATENLSKAQKNVGNKSNISSPIKDTLQNDKIKQATASAKELDKTLEQVNIPTDSFDKILSKLDLAKSELGEIVKITKQSVSDSEGKFYDSYTLKDRRGSTETYGLTSNTEKGQLLRSNIIRYDAKVAEQEAKAVQKLAEEKKKLRQQERQSTQSSVDKALKDQVSAWKQIQSIREKIAKTDNADEINALQESKKYYQEQYNNASKILKANDDLYDKEAQIAKLEQVRLETNVKIAGYKKNDSLETMSSSLKSYENKFSDLSLRYDKNHIFPKYKAQLDEINEAIKEYKTFIESLQGKGIIDESDITESNRLKDNIEELLKKTKTFSSGDRGYTELGADKVLEKINNILKQNSAMSKQAKEQIRAYYNEILSGNPSKPLNEILDSVYKIVQKEREAGREGQSWLEIFSTKKLHSFLGQAASMFSFYDLIRYIKEGTNAVKEFDDGLTKISYTMDMTKSQLDDLGSSVLEMASDMKTSLDDAMSVAQIYANMNTTAEEIKKLSEPTLILSNLTGFDSSTIADDIQAVTQQFDILAEDSMHIADVYDYISRNISLDYGKGIESIAEAVRVVGSTAKQAGLDYEQLAAIVGKTAEKTRLEGSQVGNGLKTIMTRLSKVGELSDEVDNETLSKASESLHQIGIEVYNLDGSYRQFDVIMTELAAKWDNLTDAEKANISFSIAATKQTNLLSAILSNFSDSMRLAEEATNANGSALENQQKYMESFSGHLQSLETEAKIAWINVLNSETLKNGIDLLTGLVKVVGQLVDKFGLLGTLGLGASSFLGKQGLGLTNYVTMS